MDEEGKQATPRAAVTDQPACSAEVVSILTLTSLLRLMIHSPCAIAHLAAHHSAHTIVDPMVLAVACELQGSALAARTRGCASAAAKTEGKPRGAVQKTRVGPGGGMHMPVLSSVYART